MPSTYVAHDVGWSRKYELSDEYFGSNLSWYEISMKDIRHINLWFDKYICKGWNDNIYPTIHLIILLCNIFFYFTPIIYFHNVAMQKIWRPVKISFVVFSFWNCRLYIRLCAFYGVVCMLLNEKRCIRPEQKSFTLVCPF